MRARRKGTSLYFIDIARSSSLWLCEQTARKLSLKQVELASRSLSVALLVEVSRAVFLKVGNIAPLGGKSKRGRKRQKGAIAHEPCKIFFLLFIAFSLANWVSVALALVRFIRTQAY